MLPILLVRYVHVRAHVAELLRQAEVDDIDEMGSMTSAHNEVRRLDVAVNEPTLVYELDARSLGQTTISIDVRDRRQGGSRLWGTATDTWNA